LSPLDPAFRSLPSNARAKLARAQEAWPDLRVEAAAFLAHWASHLEKAARPTEEVDDARVGDLYFAFACSQGDTRALQLLKEQILPRVIPSIRGVDSNPTFVGEVSQLLLERLLVDADGKRARVADYAGSGPFEHWLRAVALRLALNHRRDLQRIPELAASETLTERPASARDPYLEILKGRYGGDIAAALKKSLAELAPRDRRLIKLHFVDGMSLNQIGAVYQANKSTISRWLARARQALLLATQQELRARLGLAPADLEALVQLLGSQLNLSLHTVLQSRHT
jgi:RNA polymerase sigma-70 factor (ECF subfamily)